MGINVVEPFGEKPDADCLQWRYRLELHTGSTPLGLNEILDAYVREYGVPLEYVRVWREPADK